jgi:cupin superfamily acireductone dioxygenase involved in methionine salvage
MSNVENFGEQGELVDLDQIEAQLAEVELMLERLDAPNTR